MQAVKDKGLAVSDRFGSKVKEVLRSAGPPLVVFGMLSSKFSDQRVQLIERSRKLN